MRAATTRCVRRAWSERVMDGAACGYPFPEGASARYAHPSRFMLIPSAVDERITCAKKNPRTPCLSGDSGELSGGADGI